MIDIVERLRANVTWLTRDGFETSAKNVQCALAEIESLRQQLSIAETSQQNIEMTHRITLREVQRESMRLQTENDSLRQQLAEKDAEIERLKKQSAARLIGVCKAGENNDELRQQLAEKSAESDRRLDLMNTLDAEIERLKAVPMKYRRMAFNAQLQEENADLRKQLSLYAAENSALRKAGFENGQDLFTSYQCLEQQLAASQAREQQVREALLEYRTFFSSIPAGREALALPADTAALQALITKAGEVMRERAKNACEAKDTTRYPRSIEGEAFSTGVALCSYEIRALPAITLSELR